MTFILIIIVLALVFDYINGFHDAANSIATIVSTKVLTPFQAVLWAAFFNFIAFYIFKDHAVANTIGKTVQKEFITLPVIFSGLIAAIFWNLLTWWFGIPSSSSHTLIGGFAGAGITHALLSKGMMPISEIVEVDKVLKIFLFIFLAPLIGMLMSMIFTFITINRNTWIKCILFAAIAIGLNFLLIKFEKDKMGENISKMFRVDKLEKEAAKDTTKLAKLTNAKKNAALCIPYIDEYEGIGSAKVAENIIANVDMKEVNHGIINDNIKKYFKYDQLEVLAKKNPAKKEEFSIVKKAIDSLKPLVKVYDNAGFDGMIEKMNAVYPMDPSTLEKFKKAMKFDLKEKVAKEISKGDNAMIRYGILIVFGIFILSFIYTEKIKEPKVSRTNNMFKKLQLVSSAAFSIGHGGNDAQKVMGIIAAALVANGDLADIKSMPDWIPLACYAAIGLGTLSGGWKIIKTMGTKITKVTPLEGVCAETAGATTLFLTEQMGIPVSTTHTITGAIIGVGATKRLSAVRWGVTVNLLWAWILTIPISALLAGLVYWISSFFLA
ncbi:MAG: inorganic phosphate transporter [Bacteroidetes bacterium]|jgi:PiT family inorganic phosphate transporter|nr:inorganic phosphate transporter [Bacteroidota bacterium]MBK9299325.1 inorganic phosphate transporter [Bacteroidota bacterium]MBK9481979.1 inorganic phosphate transporter [Bacteroidota bacterium]